MQQKFQLVDVYLKVVKNIQVMRNPGFSRLFLIYIFGADNGF